MDKEDELTRYAEVNQVASAKASKSSAILDCVVVITDIFEAAFVISTILVELSSSPSPITKGNANKRTLQKDQSPKTQNNQQSPSASNLLIRFIPSHNFFPPFGHRHPFTPIISRSPLLSQQ